MVGWNDVGVSEGYKIAWVLTQGPALSPMLSRPPAAVSHQGITSQSDENGFDKSDPLQSDTYRINIDSAAQTGLVNRSKASAQTRFSGQH